MLGNSNLTIPGRPSMASNVKDRNVDEDLIIFVDRPGIDATRILTETHLTYQSVPGALGPGIPYIYYSVVSPATQRLGMPLARKEVTGSNRIDLTSVGTRVGSITLFSEQQNISEIDAYRQGVNMKNMRHFGRGVLPYISVNTPRMMGEDGRIKNQMERTHYGQPDYFRSFDDVKRRFIPFEDFPGRLDPAKYVKEGKLIWQYMIVTDLTRDIDKFVDPDTMDGAIEVFDIRRRNANSSISDIRINGIRCDFNAGNWNYDLKGTSTVDMKYENENTVCDYFYDSQETLFGASFAEKLNSSLVNTGSKALRNFSMEGYVSDGYYGISPFKESSDTISNAITYNVRNFLVTHNAALRTDGNLYTASLDSEWSVSDIGSRFKSSNSGFIFSKNMLTSSMSRIATDLGTDSIAFGGLLK